MHKLCTNKILNNETFLVCSARMSFQKLIANFKNPFLLTKLSYFFLFSLKIITGKTFKCKKHTSVCILDINIKTITMIRGFCLSGLNNWYGSLQLGCFSLYSLNFPLSWSNILLRFFSSKFLHTILFVERIKIPTPRTKWVITFFHMWCFARFGTICTILKMWKHPCRSVIY